MSCLRTQLQTQVKTLLTKTKLDSEKLYFGAKCVGCFTLGYQIAKHIDLLEAARKEKKELAAHKKFAPLTFLYDAAFGDAETLHRYKKVGAKAIDELSNITTCFGNTPLHLAAKENHLSALEKMIEVLEDRAMDLAKMVNNRGMFPILLLNQNPYKLHEMEKYLNLMTPITIKHRNVKKNTVLIDPKSIFSQFSNTTQYANLDKNSQLYKNLEIAIIATNETRSTIKYSSTHVMHNDTSLCERDESNAHKHQRYGEHANHYINDGHYEHQNKVIKMRESYENTLWWNPLTRLTTEKTLKLKTYYAMKEHSGNCSEYAAVNFFNIKKLNDNIHVDILFVQQGDDGHFLNVIGRNTKGKIEDISTWGEDAVLCDPQNGEFYMGKDIPKHLKSWTKLYENNQLVGGVQIQYNPRYHRLRSQYSR